MSIHLRIRSGGPLATRLSTIIQTSHSCSVRLDASTNLCQSPWSRACSRIRMGPTRPIWPGMNVPTLLVVGEEDKIFPVHVIQAVQRLIPGSRIEVVPGAAHSTHFERADVFNGLLREFIASLHLDMASAADD